MNDSPADRRTIVWIKNAAKRLLKAFSSSLDKEGFRRIGKESPPASPGSVPEALDILSVFTGRVYGHLFKLSVNTAREHGQCIPNFRPGATFALCLSCFVYSVSSGRELSECVGTVQGRATHSRAVCRCYVPCAVSGLLRHCADSWSSPRSYRYLYVIERNHYVGGRLRPLPINMRNMTITLICCIGERYQRKSGQVKQRL